MTAPLAIPEDRPVVIELGNFLWVDDDTLFCAPQNADGTPDVENIGVVEFDRIDEDLAERAEKVRLALVELAATPAELTP